MNGMGPLREGLGVEVLSVVCLLVKEHKTKTGYLLVFHETRTWLVVCELHHPALPWRLVCSKVHKYLWGKFSEQMNPDPWGSLSAFIHTRMSLCRGWWDRAGQGSGPPDQGTLVLHQLWEYSSGLGYALSLSLDSLLLQALRLPAEVHPCT